MQSFGTVSPSLGLGILLLAILAVVFYRWQRRNTHRIRWSDNDLLYVSFLLWLAFWAVINGGGLANFVLNGLGWLETHTRLSTPPFLHDPILWFLVGLFPSLEQFIFHVNPTAVLNRFGKLVRALLLSAADGLGTIFGLYWLAVPLSSGEPFNPRVFAVAVAVGLFGCYLCQYELHSKGYEIVGLEMPDIPLPPLLSSMAALLLWPLRFLVVRLGRPTLAGVGRGLVSAQGSPTLINEPPSAEPLGADDIFIGTPSAGSRKGRPRS